MALPDKPITRVETYLADIAGEDVVKPEKPITRQEFFLAKIAGEDVTPPEPVTREELYLDYIAEHGSGGSDIPYAAGEEF